MFTRKSIECVNCWQEELCKFVGYFSSLLKISVLASLIQWKWSRFYIWKINYTVCVIGAIMSDGDNSLISISTIILFNNSFFCIDKCSLCSLLSFQELHTCQLNFIGKRSIIFSSIIVLQNTCVVTFISRVIVRWQ